MDIDVNLEPNKDAVLFKDQVRLKVNLYILNKDVCIFIKHN